jgi:outer membrane protein assembly factor BamE (lipoprotein component of BamABCDE complex)
MHIEKAQKLFLMIKTVIVCVLILFSACTTMRKTYVGHPVEIDPDDVITRGSTNKGEVLGILGPPTRILRQYDGDLFVYEYIYEKGFKIVIEEPVITDIKLFTYIKNDEKRDLLVILFNKQGVVVNYGISRYATNDSVKDD